MEWSKSITWRSRCAAISSQPARVTLFTCWVVVILVSCSLEDRNRFDLGKNYPGAG